MLPIVSMNQLIRETCRSLAAPCSAHAARKFDPARDARRTWPPRHWQGQGKRVLVTWRRMVLWCHILDRFIAANATCGALDANYVW